MKRTIRIVAGVITASVAVGLGVQLWAQNATTTQAQPTAATQRGTKIAVINLAKVINKYDKWIAFKDEYKAEYTKVFEQKVTPKKNEYESLKKEYDKPETLQDKKETLMKRMKQLEREIQDIAEEAKNILGKKEAEQFVQLYHEVHDAVAACAKYYGYDMVMHYNDAFESEKDMYTPQNVARKMGHAGCMPLYVNPENDLSDIVIKYLNTYYKPASPITPAGGAAPAGTGTQPKQ
ncbi:MAG TPA: OmpH family outer membrane protein [Gemmataceae bacterium]|nr:OmpH family outer membrane protein [Gemmataceae bacterium]